MEFAQSKGNARRDGSTGITFSDVGGLGNTIGEMMQVVEVSRQNKLLNPLQFWSWLSVPGRLSTLTDRAAPGVREHRW